VRERLIGTLSFSTSQKYSFSEQELELFRLVVRQVTLANERRLQNERLRSIEQLAAAGRMSAALAHEINNPLETLGNILYLLRSEPSDHAMELLDIADRQVARLAETSHRTLALFRGKPQPPRLVNLSDLTAEVAAEIRLPRNVALRSEIHPGLCVRLVPGEFRQVLFNLLINAAQFSRPGDPVTLTAQRRGDRAELRFKDLGPGIAPELRSLLFQPFCTTRTEGGTGLGLVLSREMIERIGGTLRFESDSDVRPGTDFIVTLPLAA
jgi:signal transduction histidine kinase